MAQRQPLVLGADGLPQQLQAADTLANLATNTVNVRSVTNGESATAITAGMAVYLTAADTVKRAQANAKSTGKVIGLVYDSSIAAAATGNIATDGILVLTTTQWDAVTGQTGGLTFGATYFLDPANPGKITTTPPTTTGQVNTYVGTAMSTTELDLEIAPPILL